MNTHDSVRDLIKDSIIALTKCKPLGSLTEFQQSYEKFNEVLRLICIEHLSILLSDELICIFHKFRGCFLLEKFIDFVLKNRFHEFSVFLKDFFKISCDFIPFTFQNSFTRKEESLNKRFSKLLENFAKYIAKFGSSSLFEPNLEYIQREPFFQECAKKFSVGKIRGNIVRTLNLVLRTNNDVILRNEQMRITFSFPENDLSKDFLNGLENVNNESNEGFNKDEALNDLPIFSMLTQPNCILDGRHNDQEATFDTCVQQESTTNFNPIDQRKVEKGEAHDDKSVVDFNETTPCRFDKIAEYEIEPCFSSGQIIQSRQTDTPVSHDHSNGKKNNNVSLNAVQPWDTPLQNGEVNSFGIAMDTQEDFYFAAKETGGICEFPGSDEMVSSQYEERICESKSKKDYTNEIIVPTSPRELFNQQTDLSIMTCFELDLSDSDLQTPTITFDSTKKNDPHSKVKHFSNEIACSDNWSVDLEHFLQQCSSIVKEEVKPHIYVSLNEDNCNLLRVTELDSLKQSRINCVKFSRSVLQKAIANSRSRVFSLSTLYTKMHKKKNVTEIEE
eukprot:TRINITY_DN3233_c2_g1_i1.p1 TRINITY_DN3233_c2_g1~~TRINITY_DN3233_c2_g1_i1.p1  ORF type:complete len:559 (-),score=136.92 TRINITY_DN3233_c2_g1_i1:3303-4979(-)